MTNEFGLVRRFENQRNINRKLLELRNLSNLFNDEFAVEILDLLNNNSYVLSNEIIYDSWKKEIHDKVLEKSVVSCIYQNRGSRTTENGTVINPSKQN